MSVARAALRAVRQAYVAGLPPAERWQAAARVATNLDLLLPSLPPGIAASYAAIGDELDPSACDAALAAAGHALAFPRVEGDDGPLAFRACARQVLRSGYKGIPEPPADVPLVTPGLLLVPLLAVDERGNRIGYGKGHYDRTLAALRARGPVFAVGVAWDAQRVAALTPMPHDQPLDALVTPSVAVRFR